MTDLQKSEIQKFLSEYVETFPSQAQAVKSLKNISEAVVINIRKGNWESISDEMWTNVGKQVGYSSKGTWKMVKTATYQSLEELFDDAKEYSNVYGIVAPAGSGKSATSRDYEKNNINVYHITCAEYFNRKLFLSNLLDKMGKEKTGTASEMMDTVIETLLRKESPLLILDEADKLNDQVLYFFITLYNMLQGKCGIVLLATDYLEKRINKGRRLNKKGYNEIYSRIGRRLIKLPGTVREEIEQICKKNGVSDSHTITHIYNEYEGDLRRVERAVHKAKKKKK